MKNLMRIVCLIVAVLLSPLTLAEPLVIAHRGASGYLPEHTLEAYRMAIEQGADFIEPDLVVTRDNVLVARHDIYLSTTTNVAEVFPERMRSLEGREDWFVHDFTLAELRQLRARQPFKGRSTEHDDRYRIPTFSEVLELLQAVQGDRTIGVYPELKAPGLFQSAGHDVVSLLLADLKAHGITSDIFIQCFEAETLRRLDTLTDLPLVMLVMPRSRDNLAEPNIPLAEISEFADGVGAMKYLLMDRTGQSSGFVQQAKSLGLFVHAWTFRDDQLPPLINSGEEELLLFLKLGIDGFFTDFPDTGVSAVQMFSRTPAR